MFRKWQGKGREPFKWFNSWREPFQYFINGRRRGESHFV